MKKVPEGSNLNEFNMAVKKHVLVCLTGNYNMNDGLDVSTVKSKFQPIFPVKLRLSHLAIKLFDIGLGLLLNFMT